jgi:DNA-binding IclR family transcriptional regulator
MAVPAAEQTLGILRYLSSQASPVQAAAIARTLDLPRSTTYHLLTTLIDFGFVVHYPDQRLYGLGVAAHELGSGYARQEPLQRLARRPLAALADRSRNSAHLSVLLGRDVVYVIEERAAGRPLLITDVGVRLPALITASGRAMLAALPSPQVKALYAEREAFALGIPDVPTSLAMLRRMLVDVRARGWATEDGEVTKGLASIALPVLDGTGYPVASVAVTYPKDEETPALVEFLVAEVRATATLLARRLGS